MNRTFLLMAEFQAADIPLEKVAPKYLGMDEKQWKRAASMQARVNAALIVSAL